MLRTKPPFKTTLETLRKLRQAKPHKRVWLCADGKPTGLNVLLPHQRIFLDQGAIRMAEQSVEETTVHLEELHYAGMTDLPIRHQRLYRQHLAGDPFKTPEEVVEALTAVQAQDYPGAEWALAQRMNSVTHGAIDQALTSGAILRTHVLRPTWHLVAPADIRWLLALTAPRVHAVNAYYYRKLDLDDALLRRTDALMPRALQGGKRLTRVNLARVLHDAGVPATGLRLGYILRHTELNAFICSGGLRGKQHTYALLDERIGASKLLERDEALGELTKRYFTSRGPALLQDCVWWSGLTMADAKTGTDMLRAQLESETRADKTYWFGPLAPLKKVRSPTVHLLPNYDEYLIAYKDHSPSFDPSRFEVTPTKGAFDGHVVVVNGFVAGGWRREVEARRVTITVDLLITLDEAETDALESAAERYGRFLGLPVVLDVRTVTA